MVSKNELRNLLIICPLSGALAVLSELLVHSNRLPSSSLSSFLLLVGTFGGIIGAVAFLTSLVGLMTYSERKKEEVRSSSHSLS